MEGINENLKKKTQEEINIKQGRRGEMKERKQKERGKEDV
jgi:hypothetical protein